MQIELFSPATILTILGILGGVIVGVLYLVGIFGDTKKKYQKDDLKVARDTANFVIEALEKKVTILEGTVAEQSKQIKDLSIQIHQLIGENKTLKDLLQGRDMASQEIRKMQLKTMNETLPYLVTTTTKTNENVERLAEAIEQHLVQMAEKRPIS